MTQKSTWQKLLSAERPGAGKTLVFPLSRSDYVRTMENRA
jgi:hypothetical protein